MDISDEVSHRQNGDPMKKTFDVIVLRHNDHSTKWF